ncbi:tRNA uridine-5-carboxymethylaminomethyl(34) synthesis GTPase MnmE, partial [Thermodesulfobacteriota bacterium]
MDSSTIAAIATPIGSAGIGIIRISGPDAFAIAASIFRKTKTESGTKKDSGFRVGSALKSHQLHHGYIVDPEDGRLLDEVLLSAMKAPHSYTREDVVEINSHSGTVILKNILALAVKMGARFAEPGEFTKRAYLNGRIDLTQAEAVMDMITARTDKSLEMAAAHLTGEFKAQVQSMRETLLQIITDIEAVIDFPEDIDDLQASELVLEKLTKQMLTPLHKLVEHYHHAHVLRDGLVLAVVGKPNVGKSSLMNRLLRKERVIVSSVPGTTRDFIEETANIHGIPIVIADTAGLHETEDPVEVMGIQKTREYIDSADLILFVVDSSAPLTDADRLIFDTIK